MLIALGRTARVRSTLLLNTQRRNSIMSRAVKEARTVGVGGGGGDGDTTKAAAALGGGGGGGGAPPLPTTPIAIPLGRLLPALVLRRPSATVRTPYVADVAPLSPDATPEAAAATAAAASATPSSILQAHTPAMDCAGLITPGRRVRVAPLAASSAARRTTHSVVLAEDTRSDGQGDALVCAHPASAERLAAAALRAGAIAELGRGGGMRGVLAQQTVSSVGGAAAEKSGGKTGGKAGGKAAAAPSSSDSSRVDFVIEQQDGAVVLVEVKIVVCADYDSPRARAPALVPSLAATPTGKSRGSPGLVGVYCPAPPLPFGEVAAGGGGGGGGGSGGAAPGTGAQNNKPYTRTAIFPHGAVKKDVGVVSDRAIKHVHHLERLLQEGKATVGSGAAARERRVSGAAVLFVVARSDCAAFRPCHEACPVFARVLSRAQRRGVQVLAYDVALDLGGGGEATMALRRSLPVILSAFGDGGAGEDDAALDATVARVLQFNATDPRTHYKQKKKEQPGGGKKRAAAAAGKGTKKKKKAVSESETEEDTEDTEEEEEEDDDDDEPPQKKKKKAPAPPASKPERKQPARGKGR